MHAHSHNISGLQTNGAESRYGLTFAVVKCQKKVNYPALLGFPTVYMCTAWLETVHLHVSNMCYYNWTETKTHHLLLASHGVNDPTLSHLSDIRSPRPVAELMTSCHISFGTVYYTEVLLFLTACSSSEICWDTSVYL